MLKIKNSFLTGYREFQTSLIVSCKPGYSEKTLHDIFETGNFHEELEVLLNKEGKIIFITMYPIDNKERKFDTNKKRYLEKIKPVCDYISIIYDNQTIDYMRKISESVYVLEREFRTLIEIIFLREKGANWFKDYFHNKDNEKKRTINRDNILELIDNPLDNLDFVHLKNFVEERIRFSSSSISDRLNIIEDLLTSNTTVGGTRDDLELMIVELSKIKELTHSKKTELKVSELYKHITSDLAKEWGELYNFRNPWAHNHCLMTKSDLIKYEELASSVLKKIRTEITLLSLLNSGKEFVLGREKLKLSIAHFPSLGTSFCRMKLEFNSKGTQHILEVHEATYVDFFEIIGILSRFAGFNYYLNLDHLRMNPFILNKIEEYGNKLFCNEELLSKLDSNLIELEGLLSEFDEKYELKKLEGAMFTMKNDVDQLLNKIFKQN
ncbi:hypothetical protein Q9R46_00390 [Paenibacillus sp. RRE4]|uniref:hypothetical protein n=1 Tax=Paenibacillus sp. RRE4 TaxID=2962587 RepID=UPI00288129EA|nr:hypothetical protein [Paenibacillus sp. RRE4]MDT0121082.1 hypothetical protein [Paenibacillus sp. RRE4]